MRVIITPLKGDDYMRYSSTQTYLLNTFSVPDSLLATGDGDTDSLPSFDSFAKKQICKQVNYILATQQGQ